MNAKPTIPVTAPAGARIVRSLEARDGAHSYAVAVKVASKNAAAVAKVVGGQLMQGTEVASGWIEAVVYLATGDSVREGDWVILGETPKAIPSKEINRHWRGERGGVLSGR